MNKRIEANKRNEQRTSGVFSSVKPTAHEATPTHAEMSSSFTATLMCCDDEDDTSVIAMGGGASWQAARPASPGDAPPPPPPPPPPPAAPPRGVATKEVPRGDGDFAGRRRFLELDKQTKE